MCGLPTHICVVSQHKVYHHFVIISIVKLKINCLDIVDIGQWSSSIYKYNK